MNNHRNLFLKAIAVISLALPVGAAEATRYNSVPNECKVRMDGTSTIHDWYAESGVIGGSLEVEPGFPDSAKATVKPKAEVNIPVRSLKTSGGRKMDSIMQEHMKAAEHKMIKYSVMEMSPKGANSAGGTDFEAKGTLTIAGVTRTNTMPVTVSKVSDTKLKIAGSTKLQMTAHGITPPAPDIGLGLIKTGDEVTIKFEWVTEKAQ
jgi:polyisoprenoid-binding protein YceI